MSIPISKAIATGPAGPVLTGVLFLKVKTTFHSYKKEVINKSTSVIFGLISPAYAIYYIVLWVNFSLTSYEILAIALIRENGFYKFMYILHLSHR